MDTRLPALRNRAHPPQDRALAGKNGDQTTPEGRAAGLLLHPVRRWALQFVREHGQLTTHDLTREFPYILPTRANHPLRMLLNSGALVIRERRGGNGLGHTYLPGDYDDLRALRDYLNTILDTPEVPHETHG
ncbi:hypothetical protein [Deinococcus humi]|uniref:Uncharacterized protein n=1 Tax=Deinococcus humi TaxID=662880 RepID=A0A7W8NFS8_9DEIO|nr:hypothetical protein [Deinococcus humi]MBB5363058.1 hypothetical protein [Deinococcus humi]GGO24915.1 hypothetical protein GCM10008949_14270 [Deinococcus humi]